MSSGMWDLFKKFKGIFSCPKHSLFHSWFYKYFYGAAQLLSKIKMGVILVKSLFICPAFNNVSKKGNNSF